MQGGGGRKWLLTDTGFFLGWWKYPIIESWWLHNSVNILKITEMYTLNECILEYANGISIKLLKIQEAQLLPRQFWHFFLLHSQADVENHGEGSEQDGTYMEMQEDYRKWEFSQLVLNMAWFLTHTGVQRVWPLAFSLANLQFHRYSYIYEAWFLH